MDPAPRSSSSTRFLIWMVVMLVVLATASATILILKSDTTEDSSDEGISDGPKEAARPRKHRFLANVSLAQYPARCLRPVSGPEGVGLIAVSYNGAVTVGSPYDVIGRVRESGPASWSPSGKYFAVNHGWIYDVAPTLIIEDKRLEMWAWSPIADCLVGVTKDGALQLRIPNGDGRDLLYVKAGEERVVVKDFRFSANGRLLEVRFENGPTAVLDFVRRRWLERTSSDKRFTTKSSCPTFSKIASESCSMDGRYVVGIHRDRLVLVTETGTRPLSFGPYEDRFPEWGPPRTGVLFLRRPGDEDRIEVWFIPEGGRAIRTPLTLPSAEPFGYDTYPWSDLIDWSVSPPR